MGFTIDVFLIKQPLGVGASEFAEDRRRRAGYEREYAAASRRSCAQVSLPCRAPWHPFELDDRLSCGYRRATPLA